MRKCPYCDFYSVTASEGAELDDYVSLLLRHLELSMGTGCWSGPLESVFFGGGTPSLLDPAQIDRILHAAEASFGFADSIEISLEANPGTVSLPVLAGFRAAGVNRLSLGIQSFSPHHLQQLGRVHTPGDSLTAIRLARRAGFDNLSCDLMFALPGQSLSDLHDELNRYLDVHPEHLSCYGLTAEEGTPLEASVRCGSVLLPDDDFYAEAFLFLHRELEQAGYEHYEIANYARPGLSCRHNQGYWQRRSCLGLGAGAHSFLAADWGERRAVPASLDFFRTAILHDRDPAGLLEKFDRGAAMREALYLGLRTRQGVDDRLFRKTFGVPVAKAFAVQVEQLAPHLELSSGSWRFHPQSWLLYDRLIQGFL